MSIPSLEASRQPNKALTMVTCYDYTMASILASTEVDMILVGDSAAMVVHGHESTLPIDVAQMAAHVASVRRGAPNKLIVADMPFLSFRKGTTAAMEAVGELMKAGANAVKLEGIRGQRDLVRHIVESGVPVMGHIGLTPQSVNQLGGYRVQGRSDEDQKRLHEEALQCESAGCFSLVLECVPESLARSISDSLVIPTIGIGAGPGTDGQVLVLHDLLGLTAGKKPRFVRAYMDGRSLVSDAVERFVKDVQSRDYPGRQEVYKG